MSVTEGEDKPLKYPTIFNTADVAVITKTDLTEAVEFDSQTAVRNIHAVRPGMVVFEVSAKRDIGMNNFLDFVDSHFRDFREEGGESRGDLIARGGASVGDRT